LKFSLGEVEVWGPNVNPDDQIDLFTHLINEHGLIYIAPLNILPSWRNQRSGDAQVAKRLNRFLVSKYLLDLPLHLWEWVGCGGVYDHSPICIELVWGPKNPSSPFKFNATWLADEEFHNFVKENWVSFDQRSSILTAIQFVKNFKCIKQLVFLGNMPSVLGRKVN
jgi:hypothetical protein